MGRLHDPTRILLGNIPSSVKTVTAEDADPATFLPGLAVKRPSAGGLSLSSGSLIGVSCGQSLSDHKKTAVARDGLDVPMRLTNEGDAATLSTEESEFTAVLPGPEYHDVTIEILGTVTAGSETVVVQGNKITINIESGVTTATQMKAAYDLSLEANALATLEITGTAGNDEVAIEETPLAGGTDDYDYAAIGSAVEVGSSTGQAVSSGDATGGVYRLAPLEGIDPLTGLPVPVGLGTAKYALVDMQGGL